jgi:hypothetical protein
VAAVCYFLALVLLLESAGFLSVTARAFVLLASVFVLVGMALAAVYALGESLHREWRIALPRFVARDFYDI